MSVIRKTFTFLEATGFSPYVNLPNLRRALERL